MILFYVKCYHNDHKNEDRPKTFRIKYFIITPFKKKNRPTFCQHEYGSFFLWLEMWLTMQDRISDPDQQSHGRNYVWLSSNFKCSTCV